ncbi:CPBP family intramembrane glutamic endopeptidase [Heyndrickxia sp. MSNUG]|uniref:CPBP family intramembrane glutamic endopeptidase n=1 Tax=Heyndrickxia sp. MSNUG TaxID=3136677 RepID=UPI003C2FB7FF
MEQNFIKMNQGINNWKRYTSSFFLFMFSMFLGSIIYFLALIIFAEKDGNDQTYFDFKEMVGVNVRPEFDFIFSNLTYVIWILGMALFIKLIHKRKLKTLITPNEKINWKRVFWGFGLFFCLLTVTTIVDALFNPQDYSLNNIQVQDFLFLFLFVLILTPIQTTAEEVFFRGYLMQWFGRKVSHPLVLSIIVGSIFGALHFSNPEMNYSAFFVGSDYVLSGILWCYITARTNSAELTIGAHAANNMFIGWFLTMDDSVFGKLPSLFVIDNINPKTTLLWTVISLSVFTYYSIKNFDNKKTINDELEQDIHSSFK